MLNKPDPGQLGPGSLENPAGHIIFGLDVFEIRHNALCPFQFEEDTGSRVLLVTVARKEHFNQLGEIGELAYSPVLEFDLRWFRHIAVLPRAFHSG